MTLDQLPQNLLRKGRSRNCISATLMTCWGRRDTILSPGAVLYTLPSSLKGGGLLFLQKLLKLRWLGLQGWADTSSTFVFVYWSVLLWIRSFSGSLCGVRTWRVSRQTQEPTFGWTRRYTSTRYLIRGLLSPTETLCSLCLKVCNYVSIFEQCYTVMFPGLTWAEHYEALWMQAANFNFTRWLSCHISFVTRPPDNHGVELITKY